MPKLSKAYEPQKTEGDIYKKWEESGVFTPEIDWKKKPFVIPMPPPNVTGVLHAGHASMLAYQDILARWHRMKGDPTLWYPGTDHASISTQEVVERKIWKEEKKTRHDLGREKFLERVMEFAEDSKKTILSQTRLMGASCDWTREKYTMDKAETRAVTEQFVRMYEDGLIYRGDRIVNWCPRCGSTLANDEVEHQDITGVLYHMKYKFVDAPEKFIEVATTRPETMFGDSAVAVNPKDERWNKLIGKSVLIPVINREIPIIGDNYVDMEFGSGGLKVTPAHDPNDFEIGVRHDLARIVALDDEGNMTEEAGKYKGMDRYKCREELIKDLEKSGDMIRTKEHGHSVGHCYRCKTVVEPMVSKQWWVDVQREIPGRGKSLQGYCQDFIRAGKMKIIPKRFEAQYFNWVDNFLDWCISRQIWWGHQIPAWYCECGEVMVAREEPEKCDRCGSEKLKRDPDTLDTWFSSGLWTFGPHGWPEETEDLKYFTPPNAEVVMETMWDILTLWVIRMNLMTAYSLDEVPYQTVYLHGPVVDKNGKKMSKSRPETCIDPREVIDKYGCDAFRMSLVVGSAPGAALSLGEEKIMGFRNFCNKIWNVARFIMERDDFDQNKNTEIRPETLAQKWILSALEDLKQWDTKSLEGFKFSPYGESLYDFLWNNFADWYLEMAKEEKNATPILAYVLREFLKLAHPVMPFITEKIWGEAGFSGQQLVVESWPKVEKKFIDQDAQREMNKLQDLIRAVRSARADAGISPGKKLKLTIEPSDNQKLFEENIEIIKKLARCEEITFGAKSGESCIAVVAGTDMAYIGLEGVMDIAAEKKKLEAEMEGLKKYLEGIKKKLGNKEFVKNAPGEVVEKEKKKMKEAEVKIEKIERQIKILN